MLSLRCMCVIIINLWYIGYGKMKRQIPPQMLWGLCDNLFLLTAFRPVLWRRCSANYEILQWLIRPYRTPASVRQQMPTTPWVFRLFEKLLTILLFQRVSSRDKEQENERCRLASAVIFLILSATQHHPPIALDDSCYEIVDKISTHLCQNNHKNSP